MAYSPPLQMQDEQIWTLVIKNSRKEKVPEHYYTKKKMPLLSWPGVSERYKANPEKYAKVVGIVSDKYLVIDIDDKYAKEPIPIPSNLNALIDEFPTFHHRSKSGIGWHIYYKLTVKLPKKMMVHKHGEIYNGAFVTTTDKELSDFSEEIITTITPKEIGVYIPEILKKLQPRELTKKQRNTEYIDGDKALKEIAKILLTIPVDPDSLLSIAYETKLKDFDLNRYSHWLLVSHALSNVATLLASEYPSFPDKICMMFIEWSSKGISFQSDTDASDRFYRSYQETQEATAPIITFNTLRKLFWAYCIPIEDFPIVTLNSKGKKMVDTTDPQNYVFLTDMLNLKMCQDYITGETYVRGPKTLIMTYFKDEQFYFHTDHSKDLSIPFPTKYTNDPNLAYRLIDLFRRFGIKNASRGNPLTAGFSKVGVTPIDTLYEWMSSVKWDKKPRVLDIIKTTITIDESMIPPEIEDKEFYHSMIFKHLMNMAGLRAKAFRLKSNNPLARDRFRKSQGILIFAGYQNTRKSTWFECLLPTQTGATTSITPSSAKDTLEIQRAIAGTFVLNIDEIDAVLDMINLSDFKNVITQEKDTFRTMYSQKFEDHPRAMGFFGTTNKLELRLDRTGNRRFWIIPIKSCDAKPLVNCDYQQFWAELLHTAENASNEDWLITTQEKHFINLTSQKYNKQTLGDKSLEIMLTDDDGNSKMYDHTEIDMDLLLNSVPQRVQRLFTSRNIFVPAKGKKAFSLMRRMSVMNDDVNLSLKSFSYELAEFIDNLTGWRNETKIFKKGTYKNGIFDYNTGKLVPTQYHFLPWKTEIDELVEDGMIPGEIFGIPEKKD